ncbi:hypothetical protein SAMN05920897_1465 [Alkalispirochaeta americana]|uniref:Uncharacterized protein n=1 Tax=Alkalispirochaeta americana TaxID=159291 RepID=A0A1N6YAU7_9SPIO|nr:hypothetical protein SAMN05920897_1465 [Alkalispirochaeta americana]
MERIRRNYETDKATLAGERDPQPALARSASHDAGGAGGSDSRYEGASINRFSEDVSEEVLKKLLQDY